MTSAQGSGRSGFHHGNLEVHRLTTQRKPMWVVEVSNDWGDRAGGRYRRQDSGAHRCDRSQSLTGRLVVDPRDARRRWATAWR
jgi:hypothetical protein